MGVLMQVEFKHISDYSASEHQSVTKYIHSSFPFLSDNH